MTKTGYLIKYTDMRTGQRVYYMNRIMFKTEAQARNEIRLLKKEGKPYKYFRVEKREYTPLGLSIE